jgi:hypothetical protein
MASALSAGLERMVRVEFAQDLWQALSLVYDRSRGRFSVPGVEVWARLFSLSRLPHFLS